MANRLNNCFLINAPAGSGKTTEIKSMVQRCIIDNPKDNILCITYTNRAADELSKDVLSKNVFIGTIHSFLKPYFAHQNILELYFEIYGARISERIDNKGQKDSITESNARYIEKYGKLDYDTVKKNIKVLSYNESPFSSLYYGGLSHDDLISFFKAVFNRYPVIGKRISSKYQFVFIDEYQDTMSDVLKIFFESVHNTKTKLFLFGDRMQQIYKNYDGSFEESFELFDTTKAFFHMAGPLTLYPVTKSAAADELEKRISSVVVKSLTFPELKCFFRSAIAPLLRDFSDTFSFTTDPARRTKPSVVTMPVALAAPVLR